MVADYLFNNEAQELFAEFRVQIGLFRQFAEALDLPCFAGGVCRRKRDPGLVLTNGLRDSKPFRQHMNDCSIDIVDAFSE